MVGGEVIGVTQYTDGTSRVLCSQWLYRNGERYRRDDCNACWVKCKSPKGNRQIEAGDSLWWQGRWAMWTPKESRQQECEHREHLNCRSRCGVDYDIQLERIGYSVGANL